MREAGGEDLDIIVELHSADRYRLSRGVWTRAGGSQHLLLRRTHASSQSRQSAGNPPAGSFPLHGRARLHALGYRQILENHAVQVIQPDLCLCGGLMEAKNPAIWRTPMTAPYRFTSVAARFPRRRHYRLKPPFPISSSTNIISARSIPESRATCLYDYQPENGYYAVPDRPGIGQELTPEIIERCHIVTIDTRSPIAHKRFKSQRPSDSRGLCTLANRMCRGRSGGLVRLSPCRGNRYTRHSRPHKCRSCAADTRAGLQKDGDGQQVRTR